MKIRQGFVSNSSASSFIINDVDITLEQRLMIEHACEQELTGWSCKRTYGSTIGYTSMDNFDMEEFMKKIGIPLDKVRWAESELTLYKDGVDVDFDAFREVNSIAEEKTKEILKKMKYNSLSEYEKW